jgi:UDP-N-acetylglucosamine:LPS N-acetylglucosamine transferase
VFRPTPGQEASNTQVLESAGAAVHADTIDQLEAAVTGLLGDPNAAARMREAAARIAAPHAAETIARRVLESIPGALGKESVS